MTSSTESLIDQLAQRGGRSDANTLLAFSLPLAAAALGCAIAVLVLLGEPFQSVAASGWMPLLGKWAFSLMLSLCAVVSLYTLAHPGRSSSLLLMLSLAPLAAVTALAMLQFSGGLGGFPGTTWRRCLLAMLMLGGLGMIAAIYATRLLAPVRLRRAGFAAGLVGGGLAATAYAPFCPELGAIYLLVFYGGPIMALAGFGWLAGPKLLRW